MLFKNFDFDVDKSEQYSPVCLAMAAMFRLCYGHETLPDFPLNFSSMGKDSRTNSTF